MTLLDINNSVPKDMYEESIGGKFDYTHKDTFMGFHCGNTNAKKLSSCSMKYQMIMARSLPQPGWSEQEPTDWYFISSDAFSVDSNNALHSFAHANGAYHLMGCMLSALVQAVFEGVAFAMRDCLEIAKSQGISITEATICTKYDAKYQKFKQLYPMLKDFYLNKNSCDRLSRVL